LWVNHPARLADAAYKPVQLVTAHRCGLAVPDSVITNDADTVRAFAASGKTITKILGANTILEDGVRKVCFTRVIGDTDLADLQGIHVTTHFFQRWVPKAYEARMIVIGDHITTAAIRAGAAEGYIDWRADYEGLSYDLVDPPTDVLAGVRELMRALGLRYGALNFVITPDGEWTFLEVNAGGQYGWIEDATGAPLTEQLADLLAKGTP